MDFHGLNNSIVFFNDISDCQLLIVHVLGVCY